MVASGVRTTDFVARFGGEELAVILTQTPLDGAFEFAERLRAQVAAAPHDYQGTPIFKTASFGVAAYDGQGAPLTPEELLARADQALYRAKRAGRNRVLTWDPTFAEAV